MNILLVGYKAADLSRLKLNLKEAPSLTVHVLDIYHAHAIEKTVPGVKVVCSAHLPEGPWDKIMFKTGPKLMSGELSLDLLQEIAALTQGSLRSPRFELDFVGRERDRNDLLAKITDDPKRVRSFRATWPASVPGGEKLTFCSYPGCFCHRRQDEGGLALAEVVAKEVGSRSEEEVKSKSEELGSKSDGIKIIDMGCGCGLVGLLIADRLKNSAAPNCSLLAPHLTLIDSHTRAIEAAKENAATLGIEAEVVLADDGIDGLPGAEHTYDIFVGNPPYYSDYRIADVFLDTARKALKRGGVCYAVCKNAAGLEPVQRKYFPEVEIIKRRNYSVLKSIQP